MKAKSKSNDKCEKLDVNLFKDTLKPQKIGNMNKFSDIALSSLKRGPNDFSKSAAIVK